MREWQLTQASPMAPRIAADARTGRTNLYDDQVWQLRLGQPDEPAVTLETRYGGRVGLARVVPVWTVGRRQVIETHGYHRPPALAAFAPDYLRVTAEPALSLRATLEYWAMESQAVGGRITCRNAGQQPLSFHLAIAAQAIRQNETLRAVFLSLDNGGTALQLGHLTHLQPVLLVEGGTGSGANPRLGRTLDLAPGAAVTLRWVLAGMPERGESLALAHRWLARDWDDELAAVERRAQAAPQIETGDPDWDAALAWSVQAVLRSFLAATGNLPHPSPVSARLPATGYAVGGTLAGGFNAAWGGQTAPDALLIAPLVALAAPDLARGLVSNFLAVQRDDGWIDAKPGLDGQRAQVLAPPLLASLALAVYDYTRDDAFLADCLDGLVAFFRRWQRADVDRDQDGAPEWQHPDQGANTSSPTVAANRRWSQGVDISAVEAPDLLAYLAREADALRRAAEIVGRSEISAHFADQHAALVDRLREFWNGERGVFEYRDRDTHACPTGDLVFDAKGDQPLRERLPLPQPSRLLLRVIGGLSHRPKLTCAIEGIDARGQGAHETLDADAFEWYRGMGSATTRTVWQTLTNLTFSGLSRVYKVQASTLDLSQHDLGLLIPLWVSALDGDPAARTLALLTDPAQYWRAFGLASCPAGGPFYDPTGANGCGGASVREMALLADALIDRGALDAARDLFERLIGAQARGLRERHAFYGAYDPDTGEGRGEIDPPTGAVPFGWFARLMGAFVLGSNAVAITGRWALGERAVIWTQHGVRLERSAAGTKIAFPSGHTVELPAGAEPQMVRDPTPTPEPEPAPAPAADAPPAEGTPPEDGLLPDID
ncbi:MAG TPA: hypothetical protein PKD46_14670 [Aggregatilineaceae bacterium]|nr:hypothetical protein [Aggregatilineaceae bacterium]